MKLQCPHCHSFGLYKIKSSWWLRWLRVERRYQCVDCAREVRRSEAKEVA